MRVKSHKRSRKIRIVGHFADLVDKLDFISEAVKVGELELRHGEKVCRFLHRRFKLLKLGPEVIKLAPVCHEVHLDVEIGEEVIELL